MATILVVEDFEDSRFSLCQLLQFSGHTVLEADSGGTAVEIALRDRPDLILMDMSLPDIDGVEATERIRAGEGDRRTPIVVLSAHDLPSFHERAFAAGCDDYMTKPVDFDELEARISRMLG